jgi:3-oxoacyl-[acyl-carrier protein] reductase
MRYEEIHIGQVERLTHKVTQADIDKFVDLSGDDNRLHVDKDFAAKTSFKKPVVHGMIGASFISTIIGTKIPGDGALWYSQSLDFLLPVRVGDEITVTATVIKKNDSAKTIEMETGILNQNRQVVTKGISKVKVVDELVEALEEVKAENTDKTALVIGATGGIGSAVAMQLAKDGFNIVLHYHSNKDKAVKLRDKIVSEAGVKVLLAQADINKEASVKELCEQALRVFFRVDCLVNCASTPIPPIQVMDLEWNDFQQQMQLNIQNNLAVTKLLLPQMLERKYGKIIFIGSLFADKPNPNLVHYATAKAALEGFTKALSFELAPKGIRVNMVSPSMISTELTADIPEKMKLLSAMQTPLRRLALPEDVAGSVSFLASEKADYLSGEVIRVNGGQYMN